MKLKYKFPSNIKVQVATEEHLKYAEPICKLIEESARVRGTGIAKREPEYICQKIKEQKAIIAVIDNNRAIGFCYIESWQNKQFVANSGLIVDPEFRELGLAKYIKQVAFNQSRKLFPEAKIFGLTTSVAVMKINTELGYKPVAFGQLTNDETFWKGCQSCVNYDILQRTNRKFCLCTGMLYEPEVKKKSVLAHTWKTYERWLRLRAKILLGRNEKGKGL